MDVKPDHGLIRRMEEVAMNAWPALQTVLYDGWVLRFTGGYTRRANSINPLYSPAGNAAENIRACEELYRDRGLAPTFKMTSQRTPANLDMLLAERGYREQARTSLQFLELSGRPGAISAEVILSEQATEAWLSGYWRMSSTPAGHHEINRQMLGCIVPSRRFAAISVDGQVVACGLGVLQDGMIGLFDIVTDPSQRRQGHAGRLIETLLEWGKGQGAQRSYLQVSLDNTAALALYAKLGYHEAYQYWYRIKPLKDQTPTT